MPSTFVNTSLLLARSVHVDQMIENDGVFHNVFLRRCADLGDSWMKRPPFVNRSVAVPNGTEAIGDVLGDDHAWL
jgi:hypothetical protein